MGYSTEDVPEPHLILKKLIREDPRFISFLRDNRPQIMHNFLQSLCPMFRNRSAIAEGFCNGNARNSSAAKHVSEDLTFSSLKVSDVSMATLVLVFCAELLLSVIGNSLVLLVFACNRQMRSVTNSFIASLAVSDLLMSALSIPINIAQLVTGFWQFGSAVCKIGQFVTRLVVTASTLTLCCIAFDRYVAVVHPLQLSALHSPQRAVVLLVAVWAVATAFSSPFAYYTRLLTVCHTDRNTNPFVGLPESFPPPPPNGNNYGSASIGDSHMDFDPNYKTPPAAHAAHAPLWGPPGLADAAAAQKTCWSFCNVSEDLLWLHGLSYVVLLLLPILLMGLAYTAVVVRLWLRRPVGACSVVSAESMRVQYKRKAVKLLALVMLIFFVCWMPLLTFDLAAKLLHIKTTPSTATLRYGLQALALAAACCNPVVYAIMHDRFLKHARALLARCKLQGGSRVSPLEVTPATPRGCILQGRDARLVHETHVGTTTPEGKHATMDSSLGNPDSCKGPIY